MPDRDKKNICTKRFYLHVKEFQKEALLPVLEAKVADVETAEA